MISLDEIREDLKDVRYFYMRKKVFESNAKNVGVSAIQKKVERYNAAVLNASAKLYDLYIGLYVDGKTQSLYSAEMGYSEKHIQKQNKQLLLFLQENLKEE